MGLKRSGLNKVEPKPLPLKICVRAMDLRDTQYPILCGHYANDTIAGAEKLVDEHIVHGELTQRHHLGVYASDIGTSTIVLIENNAELKKRGTGRGALVVGLGDWGGITTQQITETIRDGVVRYLFEYQQRHNPNEAVSLKLNSLLIGYNSTTHISIESSVDAVVTGVLKANQHYQSEVPGKFDLHVGELEFVEYFLDTAITAAHSVASLSDRLNKVITGCDLIIETEEELKFTGDVRNRLKVNTNLGYWPRLIVTNAAEEDEKCFDQLINALPEDLSHQVSQELCKQKCLPDDNNRRDIPDLLKYIFLSERARAEAIKHQQQPGLLEKIIHTAIQSSGHNAEIGGTLYKLLLPLGFKGFVTQSDYLLLVLDGYTANFPWEMMLVNGEPLIQKVAIVRQFVSTRFRQNPVSNQQKHACIIGNPSTVGFYDSVEDNQKDGQQIDLPSLPGAVKEAKAVAQVLTKSGYEVQSLYPEHENDLPVHSSVAILNTLFEKPYRILMIAAHGVVNVAMKQGHSQTGVVLSDGVMLTAAEISQMEVVPQFVFLNCCHLGEADNKPTDYNKLAYSLSRELIEMGVRCIIAAGWAVDDEAACIFSKTFFDAFVRKGRSFGDAVSKARRETYAASEALAESLRNNTWGAYQAYGDPSFVLDGEQTETKHTEKWKPVAPQELLEKLSLLRVKNKHGGGLTVEYVDSAIESLFKNVSEAWKVLPEVRTEIAILYGELGQPGFENACKYYQRVIEQADEKGVVPMRAIEQLANLEARRGEQLGGKTGLALINKAIDRITHLALTTKPLVENESYSNIERSAILGSAFKNKAAVQSRDDQNWDVVSNALIKCCESYKAAEGSHEELGDNIYIILNRIQFEALLINADNYEIGKEQIVENIALAKGCKEATRLRFKESYNFFDGVMAADAKLANVLSKSGLDKEADKDYLLAAYKDSIEQISASSREMSTVTSHLKLLAEFLDVRKEEFDDFRAKYLRGISMELEQTVINQKG